MSETIKDGTGTGQLVKVNSLNQLETRSSILPQHAQQVQRGHAYIACTGAITLTSDNSSAVFYLKNTNSKDILLQNMYFQQGVSTGGSGETSIIVSYNPSATSFSTEVVPTNSRLGDPADAPVIAYKGAEAATLTGTNFLFCYVTNSTAGTYTVRESLSIAVPPQSAIAVEVTPPTGNTSMDIYFNMDFHQSPE